MHFSLQSPVAAGTEPPPPPAPVSLQTPQVPEVPGFARAVEFSRRALESKSLDELYYILTNDVRVLIDFDQALLILHAGGRSRLVATNNQLQLNDRSRFVKIADQLADELKEFRRALLLSEQTIHDPRPIDGLPESIRETFSSFMAYAGSRHIFVVPLIHQELVVGHLIFQFIGEKIPKESDATQFLKLSNFLAAALTEKMLLKNKPDLLSFIVHREGNHHSLPDRWKRLIPAGALLLVGLIALLLFPMGFDVGGEAEISCRDPQMAFPSVDGIIGEVLVREGDPVKRGQVLARLDSEELNIETLRLNAEHGILSEEMNRVSLEAGEDPASLAEKKVLELRREAVSNDLRYAHWKARALEIRSPCDGIVVTRDVASLAGKRVKAGEPFCELINPADLVAFIYVPEDRIDSVKTGQPARIYLNSNPTSGLEAQVEDLAPMTEFRPRSGNVCRVRCSFATIPGDLKIGMKGIGKIRSQDTSLWDILTDRFTNRWNQLSLHF